MTQHYSGNTQSVSRWCKDCKANTQHRVSGHKVTRVCIPCEEKAEAEHQARAALPPAPVQKGLFA